MFRKLFIVSSIILLLFGCAGTSENITGGYENNMQTGLKVYHQYIFTSVSTNRKGNIVETTTAFKRGFTSPLWYR